MANGNFLYPWARNKFLSGSLGWVNTNYYKVMFLNAGINTQYIWSATGASGYAWNPVSGTDPISVTNTTPAGAGYAITWLSQIPTGHRTMTASYGGLSGLGNSLGITASNAFGNGVADSALASTTQYAVQAGASISAFVIYKDNSASGLAWNSNAVTSNGGYAYDAAMELIAFFDSAIGMPVQGNGGDITIVWDTSANRIFKL